MQHPPQLRVMQKKIDRLGTNKKIPLDGMAVFLIDAA